MDEKSKLTIASKWSRVLTMPEWLATPSVDDKPASPAPISNAKSAADEVFLEKLIIRRPKIGWR